ncbi:MAG TPA: hypothetical protein PK843_15000 [bacterium]|nr:hypothetical protein [bacterium]
MFPLILESTTPQECVRTAAFLRTRLADQPERLALALEWLESAQQSKEGCHFFVAHSQQGACRAVAPARWVAGAAGVLEVQDFVAAEDQHGSLWAALDGFLKTFIQQQRGRLLIAHLCSVDRAELISFLLCQGWKKAGVIAHYYSPDHHQVILVFALNQ